MNPGTFEQYKAYLVKKRIRFEMRYPAKDQVVVSLLDADLVYTFERPSGKLIPNA